MTTIPTLEVPGKGSPGVGPAALEVRGLVYHYAAGRGIDSMQDALDEGLREKAREFREQGSRIYRKA